MLDMRANESSEANDAYDQWSGHTEAELDAVHQNALEAWDETDDRGPAYDKLPTGVFLAAGVADLEFETMSGAVQIEAVTALQRLVSHYQAQMYQGAAAVYEGLETEFDGDIELATGATAAEVRAALRLTRRSADIAVDLALSLVSRLPLLHEAFLAGRVDVARVKTMVSGVEHLTDDAARQVVGQVLTDAPGLTTGQLAARLRRLCLEVDPDEAADRFETAHERRRVELRPDPVGTGHIHALDLDPLRAAAGMSRVDDLARSLKVDGEARPMDQLRADVFLDLLCGADAGRASTTHVTVDLQTLIGLEDRAGDLGGFGPIIADLARKAATESRRWEYSIRDGDTGDLIAAGTTRRRPTAAQQHSVRAENPSCVFPGCRMPSVNCDLDHITDYSNGGPTSTDNLAPACRHDHTIKHKYGWSYQRLADGTYEWTSRLGLKHSTGPQPP